MRIEAEVGERGGVLRKEARRQRGLAEGPNEADQGKEDLQACFHSKGLIDRYVGRRRQEESSEGTRLPEDS